MKTPIKLTPRMKSALTRAIYLLKVAAFTDLVEDGNTAEYDETTCDGYCFKDDASSSADELEIVFGKLFKMKLPADTPTDPNGIYEGEDE